MAVQGFRTGFGSLLKCFLRDLYQMVMKATPPNPTTNTHTQTQPPADWIMKSPLPLGCGPGVKRVLSASQWERTRIPCSRDGCGVLVYPARSTKPTSHLLPPVTHTLPHLPTSPSLTVTLSTTLKGQWNLQRRLNFPFSCSTAQWLFSGGNKHVHTYKCKCTHITVTIIILHSNDETACIHD